MPNICFYKLKAVSDNKKAIQKIFDIMRHEDKEYFIYRCFNAEDCTEDCIDDIKEEDSLFSMEICGDCAWSTYKWWLDEEDFTCKNVIKYENDDYRKPIYGEKHYITLKKLCEKLNVSIECWEEEPGEAFQAHVICNNKGEMIVDDCRDWDGSDESPYEDFMTFCSNKDLFEYEKVENGK